MITGPVWDPGEKTHRDENFPVASGLVSKKHRAAIFAFYRFARAADDIADDPLLTEAEKIGALDAFEETLLGRNDDIAVVLPLRAAIAERGLSPKHAQDLLTAFRMDASKHRYANWDELIIIAPIPPIRSGASCWMCTARAAPPGPPTMPCARCFRLSTICRIAAPITARLNRVYIPLDTLAAKNATVDALGGFEGVSGASGLHSRACRENAGSAWHRGSLRANRGSAAEP